MKLFVLNSGSISTMLLYVVGGVALLVGAISAFFSYRANGNLLNDQMKRRGNYIATNLAFNSQYGVLTEDRPLLTQNVEGAVKSGGAEARQARVGRDAAAIVLRARRGRSAACAVKGRGPTAPVRRKIVSSPRRSRRPLNGTSR
jgi:hypothetical protein